MDDVKLNKAERNILRAFYWLKDETATRAKAAFYSGYSANSSSFHNALGRLRSLGLLEGWSITDSGLQAVPDDVDPKPTGTELREWLRKKLVKSENAILDALVDAGGERLSNEDISAITGYSLNSSSFNNAMGRLRTLEAAEGYERSGGTKAADVFFDL